MTHVAIRSLRLVHRDEGRRLGQAWHQLWVDSRTVMGGTDQPALNRAMTLTKASLKLLSQDYNQKVRDTPGNLRQPAILHYETRSALCHRHTLINHLMLQVNSHGTFDRSLLERARRRHNPWGSAGPGIKGNWHTGRYGAAVKACFKRITRQKPVSTSTIKS